MFDVAFNDIHDSGMRILSDFAAIFLSSADNTCYEPGAGKDGRAHTGCSVRAAIRQNVIHEVRHAPGGYGAQGVYMDEQVGGVRIEKNTIYSVDDQGIFFHCGHNNSGTVRATSFIIHLPEHTLPHGTFRMPLCE